MNEPKTVTQRRSTGIKRIARSVWYVAPGRVEIRTSPLPGPAQGIALVRTLFTGISRGTERLVLSGGVGESEWERMKAPMQEGDSRFR